MPITGAFGPTGGAGRGVQRMTLDPNHDILVDMRAGMGSNGPGHGAVPLA